MWLKFISAMCLLFSSTVTFAFEQGEVMGDFAADSAYSESYDNTMSSLQAGNGMSHEALNAELDRATVYGASETELQSIESGFHDAIDDFQSHQAMTAGGP